MTPVGDDPVGAAIAVAIRSLINDAATAAARVDSLDELKQIESRLVGKKGRLKEIHTQLGQLPVEGRKDAGRLLNDARAQIEAMLKQARERIGSTTRVLDPSFDASMPGDDMLGGGLHPIVQMMYDLNDAFTALNFDIYEGPHITSEQYEFDHLNFPPAHPARESMDTFWLSDSNALAGPQRLCLRPHLTGASVRYMQQHEPPFRFVYPGRVYRNESIDAGHERAFFQYEALIVDRHVPFTAGKLLISTILHTVFGREVPTRMRTGFFPFVEPGFEIDMQCQVCSGKGCSTCKHVGWLEIMPGGPPHPNVLRAAGLDPSIWTGFYINVGLDRLVMMRYGIDDIRLFNSGNLRFLHQYK